MSNWPDGTVQTQSGCTIPAGAPLCGDCGNGFRFPPGQARTQQAGLTDFCGAAAPQHRRGAPVSRVWGRHSPTSSRPGEQMSGAKFGPRVDTCSKKLPLSSAALVCGYTGLLHQYSDCGGVFCPLFTTTTVKRVRFGKRNGNFCIFPVCSLQPSGGVVCQRFLKMGAKKQQTFFKIYCLYAAVMGGGIKLSGSSSSWN